METFAHHSGIALSITLCSKPRVRHSIIRCFSSSAHELSPGRAVTAFLSKKDDCVASSGVQEHCLQCWKIKNSPEICVWRMT